MTTGRRQIIHLSHFTSRGYELILVFFILQHYFQVFFFFVVQRKEHLKESILFQSILILCIRHSKGHGNKGTIIFVQSFPSIQKMKIVHLLFASRASLQCDVSSGLFSILPPDSKDYFMRRFWFCRGVKQAYSQKLNLGVR